MDVNTTPSKTVSGPASSPTKKVTSPIASQRMNSANKQKQHREAVAKRRRLQEEEFKKEVADSSTSKLELAAQRKKKAVHAKVARATRETVKVEQSRSRYAWDKKRREDAAAAKVQAALKKKEQHIAETAKKAKAFNQRVEAAQRRKAEQEKEFQQRTKDAYETRMKIKKDPATPAKEAEKTEEVEKPELEEGEIDEEAEKIKAVLERLKGRSPEQRMEDAERRRSAQKRQTQQRVARHNIKAQQIQAKTAWARKRKENELRVKISEKEKKAAKLVTTPVRGSKAAKHNQRVAEVHANSIAAEEQRRQDLMKEMQERQELAGSRRLEKLTPSPPKRSRKHAADESMDSTLDESNDRIERATQRREELLMEKQAKAARHNLKTKTVATDKIWREVTETRAAKEKMEERIRNARLQRAENLRLRQENARVDNQHKKFISETSAKIRDANRINDAVSHKVDQLQAFSRRAEVQKERVSFATQQSKTAAERAALTERLRTSQQEYNKLKLENDLSQAELKRLEILRTRSLEANRQNTYKKDVARLHYDYAEAAKANQLEEIERKQSAAEERRRAILGKGRDDVDSDSDDSESVDKAITDFGRRLFNLALTL